MKQRRIFTIVGSLSLKSKSVLKLLIVMVEFCIHKTCFTHKYPEEHLSEHKKSCFLVSIDFFISIFPDDHTLKFRNTAKSCLIIILFLLSDFKRCLNKMNTTGPEAMVTYLCSLIQNVLLFLGALV